MAPLIFVNLARALVTIVQMTKGNELQPIEKEKKFKSHVVNM